MPGPETFDREPEKREAEDSQYLAVAALGMTEQERAAFRQTRPAGDRQSDKPGAEAAKQPGAEAEPPRAEKVYQAGMAPVGLASPAFLSALSARTAYLGLTGKLHVDNAGVKAALGRAGPVGEQLLNRLAMMERQGWSFGSLGFSDPYLRLDAPSKPARMPKFLALGGYHYDEYQGVRLRRLTYNGIKASLASMIGVTYGAGDPIKHAAVITGHEISHHDGTLYEYRNWKSLPLAEQQTIARRLLATETRSILTQLHLAQVLGDTNIDNKMLEAALRRRDLGGYIFENWSKAGSTYGPFSTIDRAEATRFVNSYMDEAFGKGLVDSRGRIRPFDIDAGLGKQVGVTSVDAEMQARLAAPGKGLDMPESRLARFLTETRGGRIMGRGMQGLAALGVLSMATDLRGAFRQGPVEGVARLARIGVDWGGFEAGSAVGGVAGRALAVNLAKSRWPLLALPLITIGGGITGAHLTDKYFASRVEEAVKNAPSFLKRSGYSSLVLGG